MRRPRPAEQGLLSKTWAFGVSMMHLPFPRGASGDFTQSAPDLLIRSKSWKPLCQHSWSVGAPARHPVPEHFRQFAKSALVVRNQKLRCLVPVSRRAREISSVRNTTLSVANNFASIAQRYLLRACRGLPLTPMPPAGGSRGFGRTGKGGT